MARKNWITGLCAVALFLLPQSAQAEKRKLLIGGFQDIVIDGDMQVIITTGKGPSGNASGDRHILDLLRTDRVSDVMTIRLAQAPNNDNGKRTKQPLIVYLTNQNIRNITLVGNARLDINAIDNDGASRIIVNGGGGVQIGKLTVDRLTVAMSGNGRVEFGGGNVRETILRIQGSPQYNGALLQTRKFNLELDGNAVVTAQVDEGATISNEGSGNIVITGNAECLIRKAGSAVITCPNDK